MRGGAFSRHFGLQRSAGDQICSVLLEEYVFLLRLAVLATVEVNISVEVAATVTFLFSYKVGKFRHPETFLPDFHKK